MAEVQNPAANAKAYLTRARALLLDDNQVHLNLLSNVLTSFDLRRQTKVMDHRDAKAAAGSVFASVAAISASRLPRTRSFTKSRAKAATS